MQDFWLTGIRWEYDLGNIVYRGCIGVMEKKMETIYMGLIAGIREHSIQGLSQGLYFPYHLLRTNKLSSVSAMSKG